jgi:hypothetical protein
LNGTCFYRTHSSRWKFIEWSIESLRKVDECDWRKYWLWE